MHESGERARNQRSKYTRCIDRFLAIRFENNSGKLFLYVFGVLLNFSNDKYALQAIDVSLDGGTRKKGLVFGCVSQVAEFTGQIEGVLKCF